MKVLYGAAWFFLAAAAIVSAFTGNFDATALVVFSLIALGLVHTLALWSVGIFSRESGEMGN